MFVWNPKTTKTKTKKSNTCIPGKLYGGQPVVFRYALDAQLWTTLLVCTPELWTCKHYELQINLLAHIDLLHVLSA
jgi:hypothetical protein